MKKNYQLFFTSSLSIIFISCLCILYLQQKSSINYIINADSLSFFSLLKTVFTQGFPYHSWYLSTGLYFFPEMLISLIGLVITGWNIYFAYLASMIIQIILLYLTLTWFLKNFLSIHGSLLAASVITLTITILALMNSSKMITILFIDQHASLISIILIILSIACLALKDTKIKPLHLLLISILSTLCILSDSLFLAWCTLPLLTAFVSLWLFSFITFKKCLIWSASLILSAIFGFTLRYFIAPNPISSNITLSLFATSKNLKDGYQILQTSMLSDHLSDKFFLALLLFSVMLLFPFALSIMKAIKFPRLSDHIASFFLLTYYFFLLFSITAALLFTHYGIHPRYYSILFIIPSVFGIIFFCKNNALSQYQWLQSLAIGGMVLLCCPLALQVFAPWTPIKTSYAPMQYQCVYNALSKYNLHNGISGYWVAKPLIAFSKDPHLNIAQYTGPLVEFKWLTSSKWFHDSYDFAIVSPENEPASFDAKSLLLLNPVAIESVQCGAYKVMIYGKGQLHVH